MDKVTCSNPYLKETSLTSTKHRYLSDGKIILPVKNFLNLRVGKVTPQHESSFFVKEKTFKKCSVLTTTENKFIKKDSFRSKKCYKKKKKIEQVECLMDFEDNARICDLALESNASDGNTFSLGAFPDNIGQIFGRVIEDSHRSLDQLGSFPPAPSACLFGNVQKNSSSFAFGSAAPPKPLHFAFPAGKSMQFVQKPPSLFQTPQQYRFEPVANDIFKNVVSHDIMEMPAYNFGLENKLSRKCLTSSMFESSVAQAEMLQSTRVTKNRDKKMQFLNVASMALIYSTNFKNADDLYRLRILKYADDVRRVDPEFILKVALYCRKELNIRNVSNLILSYAAFYEETRPFLEKYFESCIVLPSDWIDVAELYQIFSDERLKPRSLPSALKRVMKLAFTKFDSYQLAKYNKDKSKNKKQKESKVVLCQESENAVISKNFTLKQLIRLIHIDNPPYEVMCLLGKKYPATDESFKKCNLPGIWEPKLIGTRMKLPTPMTWETQISLYGNEANVWESLLDNYKLPYMAMLRNLRNLILAGISLKHHEICLKYLDNKNAILNSHQLPLQFYEAYKVLHSIEEFLNVTEDAETCSFSLRTISRENERNKKLKMRLKNTSVCLLKRYKDAVSKALEISVLHNLPPVPGKSLVICFSQISSLYDELEEKKAKVFHICVLVGMMCLKACEDGEMILIYGNTSTSVSLKENVSFLQSFMDVCKKYEKMHDIQKDRENKEKNTLKEALDIHLKQQVLLKEKLDHVIVLRTCEDNDSGFNDVMSNFLLKYRELVNNDLLYTDVDFAATELNSTAAEASDSRDVHLCGHSPQIVRYISERSTGGQMNFVENVDLKYDLKTTNLDVVKKTQKKEETFPLETRTPKWHTVKIFISSTFKDMHSERDVLIRYVMPELRKRAASVFVKINEIDLRWGVTEADCASKRAAELCLLEAQRSDLFIGILGNRYGTIYNFDPPDSPELNWVKDYPSGLSLTELEMYAGALRKNTLAERKAFFYFRNDALYSQIPPNWQKWFASENDECYQKIQELKKKIMDCGVKVMQGYPFTFAGAFKGKPVLGGLDSFGKCVLEDLWQAVSNMQEKEPFVDEVVEEDICQKNFLDSLNYIPFKNESMDMFIKKIKEESGIFLISGPPGCGKTTSAVNLLKKLETISITKFFIGLSHRSSDLSYMLPHICKSIERQFNISSVLPKQMIDVMNSLSDILLEAVHCGGGSFILLLDGLDHLDTDNQTLDWLPIDIPNGLKIICTASDSSYAYKVLSERQLCGHGVQIYHLPPMVQSDREAFVRHYLQLYGKVLDESPFNNQMLKLVTKKDSGIPQFLRLSCDFLRIYGEFDYFTSIIQNLPTSIPSVIEEIIVQLENSSTSMLVQTAFILLCITKEGLDDGDLHFLLSFATSEKGQHLCSDIKEIVTVIRQVQPDDMLSQVTYYSLTHAINTFAFGNNKLEKMTLSGTQFEKVAKKYYLNKNFVYLCKQMHCLLAAYYKTICDPVNNDSWIGQSSSAYRSLLYHLYNGQCYKELSDYLSSIQFLEASFIINLSDTLLEYYSVLLYGESTNDEKLRKIDLSLLSAYYDFVCKNLHILQKFPGLVSQQALNEPSESLVKLNYSDSKSQKVECVSNSFLESRIATVGGFLKNVTAATCHDEKEVALLGSEDGYLKIFDLNSKRILRSIRSHSSSITFICLAGKDRVCIASNDTTLSLWDTTYFNRVAVLKGHKHNVSCCCADLSSNNLISSGWDNSVRFWSLRDGRSISAIEDFSCPVNCVAHNPVKLQIAVGLWNGSIELWDTSDLKRINELKSSYRSVKSLAYTPDGINLVSSYMSSDILIWSSEQGMKMSNLKGHSLPVKSLNYSAVNTMIISGSDDCSLKVWPMKTGTVAHCISECKCYPISFLRIISFNLIVIAFRNGTIWIVDAYNEKILWKVHLERELVSCFSSSGIYKEYALNLTEPSFFFGTQLGNIMVGNMTNSKVSSIGVMNSEVSSIVHNANTILASNVNGDIAIFSYPDCISKTVFGAHRGLITSLNLFVHQRKSWCLSAGSDKTMKMWAIDEGGVDIGLDRELFSKHNDCITCCRWFNDKENQPKILTGSHDNNVILQDEDSVLVFKGLKTTVSYVDFTVNFIIGCGIDGSFAIWTSNAVLLTYISGIGQSSAVLSFYVSKDIENELDITLAFVDLDGSVKIEKPIQKSCLYSLEGHKKSITSCCSNLKGEVLSCSLDGTINLWKIPLDKKNISQYHLTKAKICVMCDLNDLALSSDIWGNVFIWKINESAIDSPLEYFSKKSYSCGFINALEWMDEKTFVCAVTEHEKETEVYFLDVLCLTGLSSQETNMNEAVITKIHTHHFESEIICLSTNSMSVTIVVGLKCGDLVVVTPDLKRHISIKKEDCILNVATLHCDESTDYLFVHMVDGKTYRYDSSESLECTDKSSMSSEIFTSTEFENIHAFITAFCCVDEETIIYGDSKGRIHLMSINSEKNVMKEIHDASITGVSTIGKYLFTCSLDRTVKGWNITTLQQVCQFHSPVPITCISAKSVREESSQITYLLLVGTTSGGMHLLKFRK